MLDPFRVEKPQDHSASGQSSLMMRPPDDHSKHVKSSDENQVFGNMTIVEKEVDSGDDELEHIQDSVPKTPVDRHRLRPGYHYKLLPVASHRLRIRNCALIFVASFRKKLEQ